MAKLAGRFIKVFLDDAVPTVRDISSDVESIDIPDEYNEVDVTGFSDGSENSIPGMPAFPVELTGTFNPVALVGLYTVLNAIVGKYSGSTLTVQVGLNVAPAAGCPEFEGEFWCQKMNITADPKGKVAITASLRPYGAVAPTWGTMS